MTNKFPSASPFFLTPEEAMTEIITAKTGYNNEITDNTESVAPFQNYEYEQAIINLKDLLDRVQEAIDLALQLAAYKVMVLQYIPGDGQISVDPDFSLQIIPIQSTGGAVTTNVLPFKSSTTDPIRNGTTVKLVGWSDTATVTLAYDITDSDGGIKSPGNVLMKRYNTAEYSYIEIEGEKGWIRNAKTP